MRYRETRMLLSSTLAVIDRDFFACKFCGIASSLGFCLKLPEAVSSASPRLGTIETIVLPWDADAPVAQAYPGRRFALPWAISFCPFGADGSGAGQRREAGGEREQPNSRKTLVRSSEGIQESRCMSLHAKRGDCPRVFQRSEETLGFRRWA